MEIKSWKNKLQVDKTEKLMIVQRSKFLLSISFNKDSNVIVNFLLCRDKNSKGSNS